MNLSSSVTRAYGSMDFISGHYRSIARNRCVRSSRAGYVVDDLRYFDVAGLPLYWLRIVSHIQRFAGRRPPRLIDSSFR